MVSLSACKGYQNQQWNLYMALYISYIGYTRI